MNKGLICFAPGGPEVMEWQDLPVGQPGPGEVLIRHTAIGVNFIDVYFRTRLYPWPGETLVPGAEAAGIVEAPGEGVTHLKAGDRVAYSLRSGSYCQRRLVPADRMVKIPDGIADDVAASVMLKGLTAQYLVTSSYAVKPGDTVLVHAAAGGVGLLLGQWLKALGAHAIGTAGSDEKVALALQHGYEHVINYRTQDFVPVVRELTGGEGVAAVYDSVGRDTWRGSLKCIRRRGMFVSFGQSSGLLEGFTLTELANHGSLSANRPSLFDYVADREALDMRSADLFSRLLCGEVRSDTPRRFALQDAGEAHRMLEGRQTTGATVLIP